MIFDVTAVGPAEFLLRLAFPFKQVMTLLDRLVAILRVDVVDELDKREVLLEKIQCRNEVHHRQVSSNHLPRPGEHADAAIREVLAKLLLLRSKDELETIREDAQQS